MDQKKTRSRRKHFLDTDYSIPKFNFKQAILIMLSISFFLIVGSILIESVASLFIVPVMLLVSGLVGFSIAFIQFYKKEKAKSAYLTIGSLFSLLAFIMLYFLYFSDVLI